jgi:hypothetical protein
MDPKVLAALAALGMGQYNAPPGLLGVQMPPQSAMQPGPGYTPDRPKWGPPPPPVWDGHTAREYDEYRQRH